MRMHSIRDWIKQRLARGPSPAEVSRVAAEAAARAIRPTLCYVRPPLCPEGIPVAEFASGGPGRDLTFWAHPRNSSHAFNNPSPGKQ